MKALPPVAVVKSGAVEIRVRKYASGRYGFDYKPKLRPRIQVRTVSLEQAERRARELVMSAMGEVNLAAISKERYAAFLRWEAARGAGQDAAATVASFLASKAGKGLSVQHTGKLRAHLEHFTNAFPGSLDSVQRGEFEAWLNAQGLAPRSWNNLRASIVSLYRFARSEGIVGAALCGPERAGKRKVAVTVETYSPAELVALLAVVEPEWLPSIVLQAFAGLRPEEVCPQPFSGKPGLTFGDILWSKHKVNVPASVSKTRKRRFAALLEPAIAFLSPYKGKPADERVSPAFAFHSQIPRWVAASGVKWKRDGLRHSYASYRLALTQNMPSLALEMGNSVPMLQTHYLDLKHDDEAAAWFGIRPETAGNVVQMTG